MKNKRSYEKNIFRGLEKLKMADFSLKSAVFPVFFTIIDLLLRLQPSI